MTQSITGTARKALMLMSQEPTLDPRIDWFAEGLSADFEICELGVYRRSVKETAPSVERLSPRRTRVRVDGQRIRWDFASYSDPSSLGVDAIRRLFFTAQLPLRSLAKALHALDASEHDLGRCRDLCDYFVKINSSLLGASREIRAFDLIVAADLDTLPAAVALAEEYGVPIVYDAHEYWPYSNPEFKSWEIAFWSDLERKLLTRVTLALTVSPHLAAIMSKEYSCRFDCIPNCASLGSERAVDLESALAIRAKSEDTIFLVQGGFAAHRGFELLVNAWGKVDPRAKLWLRGPDSAERAAVIDLAKSKGLFDRSVFFPEAVSEASLVSAARDADVGLVPYEPVGPNYRYCSPNKLSQYMAAGLPIICNELDFVKSIVVGKGVGTAVDFRDEAALVRTINDYVLRRPLIPSLSRKSQELFKTEYNWQSKSTGIYSAIKRIVSVYGPNASDFDFNWIKASDEWRPGSDLSAQESQLARLNADSHSYGDEIQRLNISVKTLVKEISLLKHERDEFRKSPLFRALYYTVLRLAPLSLKKAIKARLNAQGQQE